MPPRKSAPCPYCQSGSLVAKLEIEGQATVEPEGGILVCDNCLLAHDPEEFDDVEPMDTAEDEEPETS